ncbi:MAG: superoxide dismutase [Bdellovibrionaceae bacterium]|nr:superoxide dismutase [Pseudobdellovibrionaceae bacterium]MDW8190104.1 superoxide dismutase [Pseudobdellovibrionaceae bacterium]
MRTQLSVAILFFTVLIMSFSNDLALALSLKELNSEKTPFQLPELPYPVDAFTFAIDAETMTIHHQKHHKGYVDNANKFLSPKVVTMDELLKTMDQYPEEVRNNVGGHWNHRFFWSILTPETKKQKMPKRLLKEINKYFQSFENFQSEFENQGLKRFGSGWVWLIRDSHGELKIVLTPNQDNPLMNLSAIPQGYPILGIDVWEHAYYLKYKNKRGEYLKTIWSIINWDQVNRFDLEALALIKKSHKR